MHVLRQTADGDMLRWWEVAHILLSKVAKPILKGRQSGPRRNGETAGKWNELLKGYSGGGNSKTGSSASSSEVSELLELSELSELLELELDSELEELVDESSELSELSSRSESSEELELLSSTEADGMLAGSFFSDGGWALQRDVKLKNPLY